KQTSLFLIQSKCSSVSPLKSLLVTYSDPNLSSSNIGCWRLGSKTSTPSFSKSVQNALISSLYFLDPQTTTDFIQLVYKLQKMNDTSSRYLRNKSTEISPLN